MKNRYKIIILLLPLLTACNLSFAQDITPPPEIPSAGSLPTFEEVFRDFPQGQPNIENGLQIYNVKCIDCHGELGLGDGVKSVELPIPVAKIGTAELAILSSPAEWVNMIAKGKIDSFMPPFEGSLSVQDQWDVLSYVYHLAFSAESVDGGDLEYVENCAECHDADVLASSDASDLTNLGNTAFLNLDSLDDLLEKDISHQVIDAKVDFSARIELIGYLRSLSIPNRDVAEVILEPVEEESLYPLGEVRGTVTYISEEDFPEGLTVTLFGYDEFEQVVDIESTVDLEGSYSFSDVPVAEGFVYFVSVNFLGNKTHSEFYVVLPEDEFVTLDVEIMPVSHDLSSLIIEELLLEIDFIDAESIQVVHWLTISNFSEFVIVSEEEDKPTITFKLPSGATNLEFQDGQLEDPYMLTKEGFGDPSSIPPGEKSYEIVYAYQLPFDDQVSFEVEFEFPISQIFAFFPPDNLEIDSNLLTYLGDENISDHEFTVFSGASIFENSPISFSMEGENPFKPKGLSFTNSSSTLFLGGGTLLIVLLIGYINLRDSSPNLSKDAKQQIMKRIILLDYQFEKENISQTEYEKERGKLKKKLIKINTGKSNK